MITITKERDEQNRFDTTELTMTIDAITYTEILDSVVDFLRGCGYVIPYGTLYIDEEENYNVKEETYYEEKDKENNNEEII